MIIDVGAFVMCVIFVGVVVVLWFMLMVLIGWLVGWLVGWLGGVCKCGLFTLGVWVVIGG